MLSGFCHFGLVLFMVLWQSPDTPIMSCFHVSARLRVCSSCALSCLRTLFRVGAWCLDPGTHVLSFGFVSGCVCGFVTIAWFAVVRLVSCPVLSCPALPCLVQPCPALPACQFVFPLQGCFCLFCFIINKKPFFAPAIGSSRSSLQLNLTSAV